LATPSTPGRAQKARPVSQQSRLRALWENFKSIVGALGIFLILRAFLIEAYRIPSGSMVPTLLVGDWLFVNKAIYGAHIPFSNSSLPAYREPRHSDVVVFVSPYQADEAGNLRFRRSQRNFNPIMAMAARVTVVEVEEDILPVGAIDPDDVHTAGIFVHRIVKIPPPPEGWWPQRPGSIGR